MFFPDCVSVSFTQEKLIQILLWTDLCLIMIDDSMTHTVDGEFLVTQSSKFVTRYHCCRVAVYQFVVHDWIHDILMLQLLTVLTVNFHWDLEIALIHMLTMMERVVACCTGASCVSTKLQFYGI